MALLAPLPGRAAEVTRVASSFELDDPFDMDLYVGFARTQRRGKITRERHQNDRLADVTELRFHEIVQEMPMRLAFGLYEDLELHFGTSMVFNDNKLWRYSAGTTSAANSTIANNCYGSRSPSADPNCVSGLTGATPIFGVPGNSYRAGLANVAMGLTWAPFNDSKDPSKPKWVLGFDYVMPSATLNDPSKLTSEGSPGKVGDKLNRFNFSTALSKKLGGIDPYVKLGYSLPTRGPTAYTNCANPGALGFSENCGQGPWTNKETGIKGPHLANLLFGAEFLPYDEPAKHQTVGIDLQLGAGYISEGRYYNELSDALGKLLYTEEYLTVGAQLGIYARAAEYVQLKLTASLYHDTEHFLTNEPVGKDLDKACPTGTGACVDLSNQSGEINPTFDFRYDMPGRRFRISEVNVFTVTATGVVSF